MATQQILSELQIVRAVLFAVERAALVQRPWLQDHSIDLDYFSLITSYILAGLEHVCDITQRKAAEATSTNLKVIIPHNQVNVKQIITFIV